LSIAVRRRKNSGRMQFGVFQQVRREAGKE
jgi:hypothetical protein